MVENTQKKKNTVFEVVNDNDEVIGLEENAKILKEGLLRRIVYIWFFTSHGEIIFQHRSKSKDIYPDLLDATAGGKVEPNMSYEESAIMEAEEETGILITKEKLIPIKKVMREQTDDIRKIIDRNFSMNFAYYYLGKISDLKIEEGKCVGFEAWPIDKILSLPPQEKKLFIKDFVTESKFLNIFREIKKLSNKMI